MTRAVAEMWGWPALAMGFGYSAGFAGPASQPVKSAPRGALAFPAARGLPALGPATDPLAALTDAARDLLRRVSLSLTAISTRAQAYFAQLAAALAYDRALRDAKRAQDAFEATFRPAAAERAAANWDDIPFMSTFTTWLQASAAAASMWRMMPLPFAHLFSAGVASASQIGVQPGGMGKLPVWPWEVFTAPAQTLPWQTVTFGYPGFAFGFAWDPAMLRAFGISR